MEDPLPLPPLISGRFWGSERYFGDRSGFSLGQCFPNFVVSYLASSIVQQETDDVLKLGNLQRI